MAKRGAQSDLNHDNWNAEEEPEEAGKFALASEDELKKRVIKTARRRVTGGTDSGSGGSSASGSVFSGFKGFGAVTSTPAAPKSTTGSASPFSFLSNISKPTNGTALAATATAGAGGTIASATTTALGASIFATTDPSKKPFSGFGSPPKAAAAETTTTSVVVNPAEKKEDAGKVDDYVDSIKELNQSVAAWISDKVKENPLCKLTPIFKDYEKYLSEIEANKGKSGSKESAAPAPAVAKTTGFSFGSVSPAAAPAAAPAKTFSFGIGASTAPSTGSGFTFANVKPPAPEQKSDDKEAGEADEDEPPKVEFTPVEEKDSLYSKRCKLFVKADGNFSDRGVGTIHIKKVDSKVQVLVRADTNLGNILLNIILNESVPLQRMGKNNVMMICLPTPESKPPPTSVLLRVKTTEEADELFETLKKHKPA